MVVQMTNRLLATVMAMAVSSGLVAHAAQNALPQLPALPHLQLPADVRVSLSEPSSLPAALQTAAVDALDPDRAAIKAVYQRDHGALEQLRQQGSTLRSPAHQAFNQLIEADEKALQQLEESALASNLTASGVNTAVAGMDRLVNQAQTALNTAQRTSGNLKKAEGNQQEAQDR